MVLIHAGLPDIGRVRRCVKWRMGSVALNSPFSFRFTENWPAPPVSGYVIPMRIAVLSDTHNRLPDSVCARIRTADEIWHLGDVCDPIVVATLEAIRPVRVVRGNCDETPWPLALDITLEGVRFRLEHIPVSKPPECDIFLHGHTHVPRDETVHGVRFLNPGCITRPKGTPPSFAWLTVEPRRVTWKLMIV
jgi:uncharacterized protein